METLLLSSWERKKALNKYKELLKTRRRPHRDAEPCMQLAILRRNWGRKPIPSPGGKVVSWLPFKGRQAACSLTSAGPRPSATSSWLQAAPLSHTDFRRRRRTRAPCQTLRLPLLLPIPLPRGSLQESWEVVLEVRTHPAECWCWSLSDTRLQARRPSASTAGLQSCSGPAQGLAAKLWQCVESTRLCSFGDSSPSVPLYNFTTHPRNILLSRTIPTPKWNILKVVSRYPLWKGGDEASKNESRSGPWPPQSFRPLVSPGYQWHKMNFHGSE